MNAPEPARTDGSRLHAVTLFDSDAQLSDRVVPYLRDGLDRRESVLAVVSAGTERVLRSVLGAEAERIRWSLPGVNYRRLGPTFEAFGTFLAAQRAAGTPTRLLSECDVLGAPQRTAAYLRYEAVSTDVFAPYGYPWTCLWDRRIHPAEVLAQVRQVHPMVRGEGGRPSPCAEHVAPAEYLARDGGPLSAPPAEPGLAVGLRSPGDLAELRWRLRSWVPVHGPRGIDGDSVELAVNEIATNALQHGGPPAQVRGWTEGDVLVVQVEDLGRGGIPPAAGYTRPRIAGDAGTGVWLARQFSDSVATRSTPAGTGVELRFRGTAG